VDGQRHPAPGEGFQRRVVDHVVDVAVIRHDADVRVGIDLALRRGRRVDPQRAQRRQEVVEGRLATLLRPRAGIGRILNRQAQPARRQVANEGVMGQLVRGFKKRHQGAATQRQHQVQAQNGRQTQAVTGG